MQNKNPALLKGSDTRICSPLWPSVCNTTPTAAIELVSLQRLVSLFSLQRGPFSKLQKSIVSLTKILVSKFPSHCSNINCCSTHSSYHYMNVSSLQLRLQREWSKNTLCCNVACNTFSYKYFICRLMLPKSIHYNYTGVLLLLSEGVKVHMVMQGLYSQGSSRDSVKPPE